jgi:hypothetical protein
MACSRANFTFFTSTLLITNLQNLYRGRSGYSSHLPILHYLTTRSSVPLKNLTIPELDNKSPALYWTRFISIFAKMPPLVSVISQLNPIDKPLPHLISCTLPSTPTSSKLFFPLHNVRLECCSDSPSHPCVLHTPTHYQLLFDSINDILCRVKLI